MVGPRGERRLVKGTVRELENSRGGSYRGVASRGISNRGPRLLQPSMDRGRGVGRITTRSRRGMEAMARGGGMTNRNNTVVNSPTSREEDSEEIFVDAVSISSRERLGSKRTREEDGEEGMESSEPPPKH